MSFESQQKGNPGSSTEVNLEYAASIILHVFQRFDSDGGGTLQRKELRRLLRECGAKLTSKQCDDIIDQLDTDGDGEMNFAEFMSFLGRLYQLQFFGTDPGNFWSKTDVGQKAPPHHPPPPSARPIDRRPLPDPRAAPPVLPRPRAAGPPLPTPRGNSPYPRR